MATEEESLQDREVWTENARNWYQKVALKRIIEGRTYHHLAILACPNVLQQLFYFTKSLSVTKPYPPARERILTLFNRMLNLPDGNTSSDKHPYFAQAFILAHGSLFTHEPVQFQSSIKTFLEGLDRFIEGTPSEFMRTGIYINIANYVAMLGYGRDEAKNQLMGMMPPKSSASRTNKFESLFESGIYLQRARILSIAALKTVLAKINDPNILPYIHVTLELLATLLQALLVGNENYNRDDLSDFRLRREDLWQNPFPKHYTMSGLCWTSAYFPEGFLSGRSTWRRFTMSAKT
ncbi:hypothetical protein BTUL_0160g00300 [Botrytis tulipae]|uniref:DNA/RNA-binding domain-containing protein n=1 Tax=Botrytis tulipae TaxID=87230 RepID=A0A4Z1EGP6_9HELO|nr:hypothetical protein BTUL_0160g00300 [Botrytis tulipae]